MHRFLPALLAFNSPKRLLTTVAVFLFSLYHANGQGSLTNCDPVFVENFDGMGTGTTLPTAFRLRTMGATTNYWTSGVTNTTQAASTGSPITGGTYNWGTTGTNDRAVGAMSSGTFATPNNLVLNLANNGVNDITSFAVSYNAERYRQNSNSVAIQFFYSVDNGSTWISVPGLDLGTGNFPSGPNTYFFSNPQVTVAPTTTFSAVVPAGGNVLMRWSLNTGGTNSQGIGIDDIVVDASYAPVGSFSVTTANPSVPAASLAIPSASNVIYRFDLSAIGATQTLKQLALATQGTYQASDLSSNPFSLWYNTSNSLVGATPIGSAQPSVAIGSGENILFSNLNQSIAANATGFFFLTADVNANAIPGRTIQVSQPTANWLSICPGQFQSTGSAFYGGGVQTIGLPASITINNVTPAGPYCQGDTLTVSYAVSGNLATSNVFTAEMASDPTFSTNLTVLGTTAGNSSGSLTLVIPGNQLSTGAANYSIRIKASLPQTTSNSTGLFAINQIPTLSISSNSVCNNELLSGIAATPIGGVGSLTPSNAGTMSYSGGSQTFTFTPNASFSGQAVWNYQANGCTADTTFNVQPSYNINLASSFCKGSSYSFNGLVLSTPGVYAATLASILGCDSIVTLTLSMDSVIVPAITLTGTTLSVPTGFATYQWLANGSLIAGATNASFSPTTNGSFSVIVTGLNGCSDTTMMLNYAVPSVTIGGLSPAGPYCQGDTITISFSTTGVFAANNIFTAQLASDAAFTTNLAAIGSSSGAGFGTITGVIPTNQPTTGISNYRIRITSSTPAVNSGSSPLFTIHPVPTIVLSSNSICQNDTMSGITALPTVGGLGMLTPPGAGAITYDGSTQTYAFVPDPAFNGSVLWTYEANGCFADTTLVVNPSYTVQWTDTFCKGDIYQFNGMNLSAGGIYSMTLTSALGCDSSVTLNLMMDSVVVPTITQGSGNAISVPLGQAGYQWLENGSVIVGATTAVYNPTTSGAFRVIVFGANGCTDTSAVFNFTYVSVGEVTRPPANAMLFPNPASEAISLRTEYAAFRYQITDVTGRVLMDGFGASNQQEVGISNLAPGSYFCILTDQLGRTARFSFVKQ